jgi:hypothetical protein
MISWLDGKWENIGILAEMRKDFLAGDPGITQRIVLPQKDCPLTHGNSDDEDENNLPEIDAYAVASQLLGSNFISASRNTFTSNEGLIRMAARGIVPGIPRPVRNICQSPIHLDVYG